MKRVEGPGDEEAEPQVERIKIGEDFDSAKRKLKTLDDLYQLLRAEQNNRWMLILEASIVLLFIIDLILLFMTTPLGGGGSH